MVVSPVMVVSERTTVSFSLMRCSRNFSILAVVKNQKLNKVSLEVAKRVGAEAIKANVTRNGCAFSIFKHNNDAERLNTLIEKMRWTPEYL